MKTMQTKIVGLLEEIGTGHDKKYDVVVSWRRSNVGTIYYQKGIITQAYVSIDFQPSNLIVSIFNSDRENAKVFYGTSYADSKRIQEIFDEIKKLL